MYAVKVTQQGNTVPPSNRQPINHHAGYYPTLRAAMYAARSALRYWCSQPTYNYNPVTVTVYLSHCGTVRYTHTATHPYAGS